LFLFSPNFVARLFASRFVFTYLLVLVFFLAFLDSFELLITFTPWHRVSFLEDFSGSGDCGTYANNTERFANRSSDGGGKLEAAPRTAA
jgi:hypothetical protein